MLKKSESDSDSLCTLPVLHFYFQQRRQPQPRIETFANTSVVNRNGFKPPGAVVGPDDRGLWWPTLPPRPSVDEVEQRKKLQEEAGKPELVKNVKYFPDFWSG